jgi:3',5'-cyclic AMP phosphodiesterase CpdA
MSSPHVADVLTVAQLSDPHLTTLVHADARALFNKRILGYLSWRRRRRFVHDTGVLAAVVDDLERAHSDHVVVTGDLTHVGLPMECEEAAAWLRSLARHAPVTVVPGNHDRYVADRPETTVGRWRDFASSDDGVAAGPLVRHLGKNVVLIGLDSAEPSGPFLATGRLGDEQRERLSQILVDSGREGFFRLVAIHHSPLPNGHAWRKRLTDAPELMSVLERDGAELVMHGHGHVERLDRIVTARGHLLVAGAPSASLKREGKSGWNRYDISAEGRQWKVRIETRRWYEAGVRTDAIVEHRVGETHG